MNTKGTKFLAVLAVLAMAFAAFAVIASTDDSDASVSSFATEVVKDNKEITPAGVEDNFKIYVNKSANVTATLTGTTIKLAGTIPYINGSETVGYTDITTTAGLFGNVVNGKAGYLVFNKSTATTNFTQTANNTLKTLYPASFPEGTKTSTLDADKAVVVLVDNGNGFKVKFDSATEYTIDVSGLTVGGNVVATGEKGETYTIAFPGNPYSYSSGVVVGTGINNATTVATSGMAGVGEAQPYSFALIGIDGLTSKVKNASSESANTVKITSEDSVWKYFSPAYGGIDNEKMTRERAFAIADDIITAGGDNFVSVMIPQDKSSVKMTFTYYKTATPGTIKTTDAPIATTTFSIDFSDAYTDVAFNGTAVKGIGYDYTAAGVLTLTNYNGNAVFKGTITQVTLSGDNTITGKAVDHAIWNTGENAMKIKPVEGQGSLAVVLDDAAAAGAGAIASVYEGPVAQNIAVEGSTISVVVNSVDQVIKTVYGIYGANVSLYESSLSVSLDAQKTSTAIKAATVDLKSCANVTLSAKYGIDSTGNVDIAASKVTVTSSITGLKATNLSVTKETELNVSSAISIPATQEAVCGMRVATINAESDSVVTVDDIRLTAAGSTNNATITVNGDLVLETAATFTNKATMEVKGKTLIIGKLYNQGTFTATGDVNVSAFDNQAASANLIIPKTAGGEAAKFAPLTSVTATSYYVRQIEVVSATDIELNADGNAIVWAKITFGLKSDGEATTNDVVTENKYIGTATLNASGKITAMNFVINTTDGTTEYLLPINVAWTSYTDGANTKYQYAVDANGKFYQAGVPAGGITVEPSKYDNLGVTNNVALLKAATTAGFEASAGTFTAAAGFAVNYAQAALVSGTGALNAAVTVNDSITLTAGTLTGDITVSTADKAVTINKDATVNGKIKADKAVDINVNGTLKGDIAVKDNVTTLDIAGKYDGILTISGKYKGTSTSTAADTDYSASVEMKVIGKGDEIAVSIATVKSTDAAPGAAGYINFTAVNSANFKSDSSIRSTAGVFQLGGNLAIPTKLSVSAASTGTISIAPSYTVTINGAIVIDDGATFNYYDADAKIYSYGKANNEIKFAVEGKTYYCSFEYALGNAPAGTPLTVTTDVNVADNTAVKDGVVITVSAGKTVTIAKSITMGDGASFNLMDGAKVLFKTTPAEKVDGGVFTYGDNKVILTGVVFTADDSTITAVKAAGTITVDRISVDVKGFNAGTIEFVTGEVAGNIVYVTKAGTTAATDSSGSVIIDDGAKYVGTFVYVAKAKITNNGIYAPISDVEVNVAWSGSGSILLAENKKITIAAVDDGTAAAAVKQNMTITDGTNSIVLKDACFESNGIFTAVKATSTVPAHIAVSDFTVVLAGGEPTDGTKYVYGDFTINGNVALGDLAMYDKATIVAEADSVISITATKKVFALGLLKSAGTINKKVGDDATYGELKNQIEYTEGAYTVYAYLGSAITEGGVTDFTVSNNITLAGGNAAATTKALGDVSLAVAEGKKLTINGFVSIGTASTTLGAGTGVSGNIVLGAGAVLIVYDNAAVDPTKVFTDNELTTKAKMSQFIISYNDAIYATVFVNGAVTLATVEGALNPTFDGYRFTGYSPYVVNANNVGDSDVRIMLDAGKVSVILASVEGVTYYINNVAYKQTGVPVELKVGDTVSAQANAGYTGTVKVNGESFITVDAGTKTITASGATPITPEPEPETGGITLTEILLIVLVILIAVMVVVLLIKLNRS